MGHAAGIRELLVLPVNPTYLATTGVRSEVFRVERRNTQSLYMPRGTVPHAPASTASHAETQGIPQQEDWILLTGLDAVLSAHENHLEAPTHPLGVSGLIALGCLSSA